VSKSAKLSILALATFLVAGVVVFFASQDPEVPTASAPRGAFASERASDEIGPLPTR